MPERPDDGNALIDACIAFYPDFFADCPSLAVVRNAVKDARMLDFCLGKKIPKEWAVLREEARARFGQLLVVEGR